MFMTRIAVRNTEHGITGIQIICVGIPVFRHPLAVQFGKIGVLEQVLPFSNASGHKGKNHQKSDQEQYNPFG